MRTKSSTQFGPQRKRDELAGIGVGGLLYASLRPPAGQVSVTSSGGIWAYVVTGQLLGIIQPDVRAEAIAPSRDGATMTVGGQW